MTRLTTLLPIALAASLVAAPATAKDKAKKVQPYDQPDGSWISLSGTAVSTSDDTFVLDYGRGLVTVEVDDWDRYPEAKALIEGDQVTVYGRVDDDLFEITTIEAGSVYVEGLGTYFHASPADEESARWVDYEPGVVGHTTVWGSVDKVDSEKDTFTVDIGARDITVHTDEMTYDPLDEYGWQQINPDDLVRVTGRIDNEFFGGRVLDAHRITTIDFDGRGSELTGTR